jgi:uncharacterized protein YprB with RNaseH-like and TPR domain
MREDLRKRLRELGVARGVRELGSKASGRPQSIEDLVPGRFSATARGECFVAEERYSLDYQHGEAPLSSFLDLGEEGVAAAAQEPELTHVAPERCCFLDTETTGLSGGTGTMAFVVGLGFFREGCFSLRQYFLRDPGDEPAMIEALAEVLSQFEVCVSFNGRAFDVPILDTRFVLDRRPPISSGFRQLDLLHAARRLWRYRLDSCALGVLERELLGVEREQADVPSGVIPLLYRDYLRTGDAREMKRVIYHNAIDILSLVTLASRLGGVLSDPWAADELTNAELLALARWYGRMGNNDDAERAYRLAIGAPGRGEARGASGGGLPLSQVRAAALQGLAYLLKRAGRRAEALAYWQQLALEPGAAVPYQLLAHVEMAKQLEWFEGDLALAAAWTETAIERAERSGEEGCLAEDLPRLRHRLARLERKRAAEACAEEVTAASECGPDID